MRKEFVIIRTESDESELCTGSRVTFHREFDFGAGNAYCMALPQSRPSTQSIWRNRMPR